MSEFLNYRIHSLQLTKKNVTFDLLKYKSEDVVLLF
ncbi:MAG: hypothetical protein ACI83B_001540 [Sediminicola sp.]|jgi:hypothetical protein